ncbi:MAG TPA: anhydro-N-acetylmuramic acid kinase, partial [Ferruginibacter sp.]|nr:anhydro-N-acetylmuramic acid kinase [Ferruginibacter sp.]
MNNRIEQLYQISRQPQRRILGLMSGTSLDGLDLALCCFHGSGLNTHVQVEQCTTIPYDAATKEKIRQIFAQANGSIDQLTRLNGWIADWHAQCILQCLNEWQVLAADIDALASHGQTIYHAPHPDEVLGSTGTLQLGDGDRLAGKTGIITLSD